MCIDGRAQLLVCYMQVYRSCIKPAVAEQVLDGYEVDLA